MRVHRAATILIFAAALVVCIELFAGMVVLKNGHRLDGSVIRSDEKVVVLGYSLGTLTLSRNLVERVVEVRDLSEYGKLLLPPANQHLIEMEREFLGVAPPAKRKTFDKAWQDALISRFRTTRHNIEKDGQVFSLELPASFKKSKEGGILVLSGPGDKPCASICLTVVKTPPVTLAKQAELTEAAAASQLSGYSTIYSVTRRHGKKENGECVLLGTYGPTSNPVITRTVLLRAPDHTLAVTFFLPRNLYDEYGAVFSLCQDTIELKERGN